MKLIYCSCCNDVFSLSFYIKKCHCGKSYGKYIDKLNAQISESAIPIGFNNREFNQALNNQPDEGMGKRFDAFVIPKQCDTIEVI
jgi:hypothetical protein